MILAVIITFLLVIVAPVSMVYLVVKATPMQQAMMSIAVSAVSAVAILGIVASAVFPWVCRLLGVK